MAYADYAYYSGTYGGAFAETDYNRLSGRASAYIDAITFGRAAGAAGGTFDGRLKDACCAVADAYALAERGGIIASESNDGVSVTYVAGVSKLKTEDRRLYDAAALYLGCTGLLFRGG